MPQAAWRYRAACGAVIYIFEMAEQLGLDLVEIIEEKLQKNAEKYPVEKAKGRHTKYDRL